MGRLREFLEWLSQNKELIAELIAIWKLIAPLFGAMQRGEVVTMSSEVEWRLNSCSETTRNFVKNILETKDSAMAEGLNLLCGIE